MTHTCKPRSKDNKECKGLRLRAHSSFYVNGNSFEERRGFRLLKKQSCVGCEVCQHTWDYVKEVLSDYDELPVQNNLPIDTFQDYTVSISGCDGEDMEFVPIGNCVYK